jgi:hypothetical protein
MVERIGQPQSEELKNSLAIDPDNLDECLVAQPGLFYHVAEQVSIANSRRDAIKLDLEVATAECDKQVREAAAQAEEKVTEPGIQNRLRTMPRIKNLSREYLEARTKAETLLALKEAYLQRSFMLRELVALSLSQATNVGLERGATSARHNIGDRNRQRGEEERRRRDRE